MADKFKVGRPYNPKPETEKILERAWFHYESVPYKVSLRWLFYRLYHEGYYKDKDDYKPRFIELMRLVRRIMYKGWRPDSIEDDTRTIYYYGIGASSQPQALATMVDGLNVPLSHFPAQGRIYEIWFEARAMRSQFEYHTKEIPLIPFGGDPSVELKWRIAKGLETLYDKYKLPILILYFGDLDKKGGKILENNEAIIREYCNMPFDVVWCGLTMEQVDKYNIDENPNKPGAYQWEAVDDTGAGEIITEAIKRYVDIDIIDNTLAEQVELEDRVKEKISELII